MSEAESTKSTDCPVCGANVLATSGMVVGELLTCSDCGTELEVLGVGPFAVQEAPQAEEDWGQ